MLYPIAPRGCQVLATGMARRRADTMADYGTCDTYCNAQSLVCVGAWEEDADDCVEASTLTCTTDFATLDTNDAICECQPPGYTLEPWCYNAAGGQRWEECTPLTLCAQAPPQPTAC